MTVTPPTGVYELDSTSISNYAIATFTDAGAIGGAAAFTATVDWGDGIFGAQAAAQDYFGTDAAHLTAAQSARLAAILPNPHKWKAAHPGRYVARRAGMLQGRERMVTRDGLNFCVK